MLSLLQFLLQSGTANKIVAFIYGLAAFVGFVINSISITNNPVAVRQIILIKPGVLEDLQKNSDIT